MTDDRLRLYVERIERVSEEIAGLQQDRKDIYAEAKAVGYCPATLRKVIARRGMDPADRAEADMLVETYEAALGGTGPDPAVDPDQASREMALAILAEQIEGIADPVQAAKLAEHVTVLLDIRAEVAELRRMEAARKALAATEGFDKPALTRVVRWIEKCAKHGADAMRAGEAVFQMYRGTVEGRGIAPSEPVTKDPKLQGAFGAKGGKPAANRLAWFDAGGN